MSSIFLYLDGLQVAVVTGLLGLNLIANKSGRFVTDFGCVTIKKKRKKKKPGLAKKN